MDLDFLPSFERVALFICYSPDKYSKLRYKLSFDPIVEKYRLTVCLMPSTLSAGYCVSTPAKHPDKGTGSSPTRPAVLPGPARDLPSKSGRCWRGLGARCRLSQPRGALRNCVRRLQHRNEYDA